MATTKHATIARRCFAIVKFRVVLGDLSRWVVQNYITINYQQISNMSAYLSIATVDI